jgi:hypothetical protein
LVDADVRPVDGLLNGAVVGGLELEPKEFQSTTPYHNLDAATLEEHTKNTGGGEETGRRNDDEDSNAKTQVGAGLLFGIPGLIIGGPILGLLLGVGAEVVSKKNDGPAGEGARMVGAFAIEISSVVGEKAREVNEKHGILDKIMIGWGHVWRKVQQFDKEHKIGEKAKEVVGDVK